MGRKEMGTRRPATPVADDLEYRFAPFAHEAMRVSQVDADVAPPLAGAIAPTEVTQTVESNHLLELLRRQAPAEYALLTPHLELVTLERQDVIFHSGEAIAFVYFPERCVASVVKILSDGRRIEVGTAGREGMAGFPAFLDGSATLLECFVRIPGEAKRLPVHALHAAAAPGSIFRGILQRYGVYLFDQAAQTAACNRLHTLDERCARWLLMTHDRVRGDQFELTHEFLSILLGVRRAGVSQAADGLQRQGFIRYRRGKVVVVNRSGLEGAACECYATDRADFERLLSQSARSSIVSG
ncbi:MAG: Crp/Fnr family transcriptional regulator [Gemmatimonadaceae bacterium]